MRRHYTDEDRVKVLARLEVNAGNASITARETGIPRPTVLLWRDQALEAGEAASDSVSESTDRVKTDWAAIFGEALSEAVGYLRVQLPEMKGRDLAIAMGILADKHLDHMMGRKGASLTVDNRHQTIALPEGTSLEDLRALRDGLSGNADS